MGHKKLNIEEKAHALTQLNQGMSVYHMAAELHVTPPAIYQIHDTALALPPGKTPPRKKGSRAPH